MGMKYRGEGNKIIAQLEREREEDRAVILWLKGVEIGRAHV